MTLTIGDKVEYYKEENGNVAFAAGAIVELRAGARGRVHVTFKDDVGAEYVAVEDELTVVRKPHTLAEQDHADLIDAARLVHGVMDRHDGNLTGPALAAFGQAILDMRIGERYLGVSES